MCRLLVRFQHGALAEGLIASWLFFIPRFLRSWNVESLLTTSQAAEHLQLSEYTLREKLKRGEIKSFRIGNSYRIRPEWLEEFISRQAV